MKRPRKRASETLKNRVERLEKGQQEDRQAIFRLYKGFEGAVDKIEDILEFNKELERVLAGVDGVEFGLPDELDDDQDEKDPHEGDQGPG